MPGFHSGSIRIVLFAVMGRFPYFSKIIRADNQGIGIDPFLLTAFEFTRIDLGLNNFSNGRIFKCRRRNFFQISRRRIVIGIVQSTFCRSSDPLMSFRRGFNRVSLYIKLFNRKGVCFMTKFISSMSKEEKVRIIIWEKVAL